MSFFPDFEPAVRPRLKSESPPWFAPPANVLPYPVPIVAVLARRPGVAVCLRRIDVYPDGWRFALSVRAVRTDKLPDDDWFDVLEQVQSGGMSRRHRMTAGLRLGIELQDGSKIIGDDRGRPPAQDGSAAAHPRLTIRHSGGGGGEDEYDLGLHAWLWPSPPPGSFRLVCDWPALELPETSREIVSTELFSARELALDIWDATADRG